jgi:hypothetical protein
MLLTLQGPIVVGAVPVPWVRERKLPVVNGPSISWLPIFGPFLFTIGFQSDRTAHAIVWRRPACHFFRPVWTHDDRIKGDFFVLD